MRFILKKQNKIDAKDFAAKYGTDFSGNAMTAEQTKAMASDLQNVLNNAAAEAGIKGTVTVKAKAAGQLKFTSDNTGSSSSFGFVGTDATSVSNDKAAPAATDSWGATLMGTNDKNTAKTQDAEMKFNSTVAANSNFTMTINGTEVKATIGTTAIDETTTLSTAANTLQTSVQAAVDAYNTAMGYTAANTEFLKNTDFTVEANKDGSLSVKYNGSNKNVDFSFGEYTSGGDTTTTATKLGLVNKQSAAATQSKGVKLQIGANEGQTMEFTIDDMSAAALGVDGKKVDLSNQDGASEATTTIDAAIKKVSAQRSQYRTDLSIQLTTLIQPLRIHRQQNLVSVIQIWLKRWLTTARTAS